jgi:hypothetical protein
MEEILLSFGYKVRYEKGNFHSSPCRIHANQIIVINKFLEVSSRVEIMFHILLDLELDLNRLSQAQKRILKKLEEVFKNRNIEA